LVATFKGGGSVGEGGGIKAIGRQWGKSLERGLARQRGGKELKVTTTRQDALLRKRTRGRGNSREDKGKGVF